MDNMSVFEFLGMEDITIPEDASDEITETTSKKEGKKSSTKSKKKKGKSASKGNVNETFSNERVIVDVYEEIFTYDDDFKDGEFTANDIIIDLISKGYIELKTPFSDIVFKENEGVLIHSIEDYKKDYLNHKIEWIDDCVTVVYGADQLVIYKDTFNEYIDANIPVCVKHVFNRYLQSFENRVHLVPLYDVKSNIIVLCEYPLANETILDKQSSAILPGDEERLFDIDFSDDEELSAQKFLDEYKGSHIINWDNITSSLIYQDEIYKVRYFGKVVHDKSSFCINEEVEETVLNFFEAPFILKTHAGFKKEVTISTFNTKYVKKEVIEAWLCKHFTSFRTAEAISIESIPDDNLVYCSVHTGSKGCIPFECETHSAKIVDDKLEFTIYKKLPINILDETMQFFEKKLPYEAVCQVWYDTSTDNYFLHYPTVYTSSREYIEYNRVDRKPSLNEHLVASFHSHGFYKPYFSPTDDKDEQDPCIYGVFGYSNGTFKRVFRGGYNNYFVHIDEECIF